MQLLHDARYTTLIALRTKFGTTLHFRCDVICYQYLKQNLSQQYHIQVQFYGNLSQSQMEKY